MSNVRLTLFSSTLVTGALIACGGSTTGGGGSSISGTVAGTTFSVASSFAFSEAEPTNTTCGDDADGGFHCTSGPTVQILAVVLSNRADFTLAGYQSLISNKESFANLEALGITLGNESESAATGTYAITGTNDATGAHASLLTLSSTCVQGLEDPATSGTVTVTQLSATNVAGTYTATFGTQGTFTGSFNVPVGAAPDAGITVFGEDAGTPTCEP